MTMRNASAPSHHHQPPAGKPPRLVKVSLSLAPGPLDAARKLAMAQDVGFSHYVRALMKRDLTRRGYLPAHRPGTPTP